MTKKKVLAIIPARGGSKGLPRKNIIELAGKPLIAWTIEACLNSKYITKTIVSSDDDEILTVSRKYGADTIKRPIELASDVSPSEPIIEHTLEGLEERFEYVVFLQPTSPLRGSEDIDTAMDFFLNSDSTALISVCEIDNKVLKALKINSNGYIEGISNNEYPFMRRQDLPKVYMPNGAIYIITTDSFVENRKLFTDKTVAYEMDALHSLDIDSKIDLDEAERYIMHNNSQNNFMVNLQA